MEPVTHLLTGACLGRSGFNRKTAYATLAMTLAAEAPDLDMFWGIRGPVEQLQHHRGWTHAFAGAPVVGLATVALVWVFHRVRRREPVIPPRWGLLWAFATIAALSHILLDYTNNYGVRPFFPFNPHWYAWSIEFIWDPVMFGALVLALVVPWILGLADQEIGGRKTRFRGRWWASGALCFVLLWYGVRNAERLHAIELIRTGDYTREPILRVAAEPHMMSPFRWTVLMETKDYYQVAQVLTVGDRVTTNEYSDIVYKAPVTPAVAAAKQSYLGRVYLDWSQWPVTVDRGRMEVPEVEEMPQPGWHTVEFMDMRFGYWPLRTEGGPPLSGWVYVGPNGTIEEMFMQGKVQKAP